METLYRTAVHPSKVLSLMYPIAYEEHLNTGYTGSRENNGVWF